MIYLNKNHAPDSEGWLFYQPQTNWKNPVAKCGFKLSVEAIQEHRKKHPDIVKSNRLPVDFDSIANELLKYTSERTGIPIRPDPATFQVDGPTVCKIDKTGFPTIEEITQATEENLKIPKHLRIYPKITVVIPTCQKDMQLTIDNLRWQKDLDGKKDFTCILCFDASFPTQFISTITQLCRGTFEKVSVFKYPAPPTTKWPYAPNWSFQHTARYMFGLGKPWFWMEPDCIPLKKNWLDLLNQEYMMCNKPIMGSIIGGMGHCNGTAIYPHNICKLSNAAMTSTSLGWDSEMKDETIHLTHPSKLMYHIWGIDKGVAVQNGGTPVVFRTWDDVKRWVDFDCVTLHRCKNSSLIKMLTEHR